MTPAYARLLRIDSQLTLRVTQDGQIKGDYAIDEANAAFLVAEGALFVRDRMIEMQKTRTAAT